MLEEVSGFPDLRKSICKGCPFGVVNKGGGVYVVLSCVVFCFNLIIRFLGKLFLWAICRMFHSSWRYCWRGRVSIILMRNRYAVVLYLCGWLSACITIGNG
jgi:hypothetical protein